MPLLCVCTCIRAYVCPRVRTLCEWVETTRHPRRDLIRRRSLPSRENLSGVKAPGGRRLVVSLRRLFRFSSLYSFRCFRSFSLVLFLARAQRVLRTINRIVLTFRICKRVSGMSSNESGDLTRSFVSFSYYLLLTVIYRKSVE